MTTRTFSVTWDYRCPFAAIANDHLVTAIEAGAPFDVTFIPYTLSQGHNEDKVAVWDDPTKFDDLRALAVGVVARDRFPESFLALHRALFDARHLHSRDLRDEAVLREVIGAQGLDADVVFKEVDEGWAYAEIGRAYRHSVDHLEVFGVPTFIVGDRAAFVRLMHRPADAAEATDTIERVVGLLADHPEINELKHTSLAH